MEYTTLPATKTWQHMCDVQGSFLETQLPGGSLGVMRHPLPGMYQHPRL